MIELKNAFDALIRKHNVRILILGLKNSGKTKIMTRFEFGEIISSNDSNLDIEDLYFMDVNLKSWDVDCGLQPECKKHYDGVKGLVFVVDRSDKEKIKIAKTQLHAILSEPELKNILLLIVANKQDLPNAMTLDEVTNYLDLKSIQDREWNIMDCCANDGYDLCSDAEKSKGLKWFFDKIS